MTDAPTTAGRRPRLRAAAVVTAALVLVAGVRASRTSAAGGCDDARHGWRSRGQVARGIGIDGAGRRLRFADIDGDRRADYLLVGEGGMIRAWLNRGGDDGGGGWRYRGLIASGAGVRPDQVRFADLDGDGDSDYVVTGDGGSLEAWMNEGRAGDTYDLDHVVPGWRPVGRFARGTGDAPDHLRLGDLDGDGRADYVVVRDASQALDGWRNLGGDAGGGGWSALGRVADGAGGDAGNVTLVNVDCDGRADYVVQDPATGALTVWVNRGTDQPRHGGWTALGRTAAGAGGGDVRLADLDGDGRADYLVIGDQGQVTAWENQGGDPG